MSFFNSNGANILVVDDEPSVVDVYSQYLTRAGYKVQSAANGKEALDVFKKDHFQLVITDIEMPEIDGMALLDKIKAVDKYVVVIMVTGYGTIERAVEAFKKGAYDFLEKPLNLKALDMAVNRALERYFIYKNLQRFRVLFFMLVTVVTLVLLTGVELGHFFSK